MFFLLLFAINLLFAKRGNRLLNILLGTVLFARFGQVLLAFILTTHNQEIFPLLFQLFLPSFYAIPIFFYLYINALINQQISLKPFQWLHLIPVALAIVHVLPWPNQLPINWDVVIQQWYNNRILFITESVGILPSTFYYIFRPILVLVYIFLSWITVLKPRNRLKISYQPNKNWIYFVLFVSTFFQLVAFLPLIINYDNSTTTYDTFFMMNCALFVMLITFVLHKPNMFYNYIFLSNDWEKIDMINNKLKSLSQETPISVPKKLNITKNQVELHIDKMKEIMVNEKPYLTPNFQISDLARSINIPTHQCSYILNNSIGKNFRDWINEYRINHFIEQYPILSTKMTIESIARDCGFKSTATFYNAFKKETGLMPKVYFSSQI
jgi:AraC-like DNA-binding protein